MTMLDHNGHVPNEPDDLWWSDDVVEVPPPIEAHRDPTLPIEDIAAVIAEVDAMPPPVFIARPVWPADAYGIIGAESKAGKTWAIGDLAVNVAGGGSWLGQYPCDRPGPVLAFLGEGGKRKTIRRWRAICQHYELDLAELPIRVSHRVPQLAVAGHIDTIRKELADHPAVLVIVDPLYLAAKGAKASDLFAMAEVLEPIQHACDEVGAALVLVHHWNLTGTGTGKARFSGTGSEQWGRVLASVSVASRHTDPTTRETSVVLAWEFLGEEIPDTELRVRRNVMAEDPDDLASPMRYSVELADAQVEAQRWDGPTQCMDAVLHLLEAAGLEMSKNAIRNELRDRGNSYRNETVGQACEQLAKEGRLTVRTGPRSARLFSITKETDSEMF